MPARTPQTLPASGRVFQITLPDDSQWFALFVGALLPLATAGYWEQSDGGVSVDETAAAFIDVLWGLLYHEGA